MRTENLKFKVYVAEDGSVKVLDPSVSLLPFLQKLNPGLSIPTVPPPAGYIPNFQKMRRVYVPDLLVDDLERISTDKLWNIHQSLLSGTLLPSKNKDMANLLEVKEELCRRIYRCCGLCPLKCGVNRFETTGRCGLGDEAYYSDCFVHIAEEPPINPAINIKLAGCNLRCVYCHTWENLKVTSAMAKLDEKIWKNIANLDASSLEFVGGEPTTNLLSILEILNLSPYDFTLPVVWNSNGYLTQKTSALLSGLVDVYIPDYKYGNDDCAFELSGVTGYVSSVQDSIKNILMSGVRTIVRLLLLPDHLACCHEPTINWLAKYSNHENLWVGPMDQYVPEFKASGIKKLSRYPVQAEIEYMDSLIETYGLKNINKTPERFWK